MQTLELKVKGLYLSPNDFSSVPLGSLLEAKNCVLDKESLLESMRGQKVYSAAALSNAPDSLFGFNTTLLAYDGDSLYRDDGTGTFTAYTGSFTIPDTGYKIRAVEANQNFYFTTSVGIKKLDAVAGTVKDAGAPPGLDVDGTLNGSLGFLPVDSGVAYRVVWGYKDANGNVILGAPSQRFTISNPSSTGHPVNVELYFTVPSGITTSWFYQVYRSDTFTPATVNPNDELYMAYEGNPTAGQITAKIVTVTDATPDTLLGATLYTSPTQQGIENANNPPPYAKDIALFNNMTLFANTKSKHRLLLTLIGSGDPAIRYVSDTGNTTLGAATITSLSDTSKMRAGMKVSGTGAATGAKILTVDSPTQITMTANATANGTGVSFEFGDVFSVAGTDYYASATESIANKKFQVATSGTPAENIEDTSISLVRVVNRYTGNTSVYAYYLSGFKDLPGKLAFEERSQGGATFYVTSTAGDSFNPTVPSTGTTLGSSNDPKPNGVFISKANQPEAVPLYAYVLVGSANKPIRRVLALRDSVFIFKDDGIFRLTGADFASIVVSLFDGSKKLYAYDSPAVFDNQIFCYVDQGIAAVSEQGVQILSKPIESQLLASAQYANFPTLTFGVGYDSDRKYMLWSVSSSSDTYATMAWVWNSITSTWTTWERDRTCGVVLQGVNKLFMGHPVNKNVYVERKTLSYLDYADEEVAVVVASSSGVTVTLSDATGVLAGDALRQGDLIALIEDVDGNDLTVNYDLPWVATAAIVDKPFTVRAAFTPLDGGNPSLAKHYTEATYLFKNALWTTITAGFSSHDMEEEQFDLSLSQDANSDYGMYDFGDETFGGGQSASGRKPLRTYIPTSTSRANWVTASLELTEPFTNLSLMGLEYTFNPMTTKLVNG